jgi:chloramphenicol-sensitive protein RarD
LVPLYFKAIAELPPLEILAHRVVWSVVFLAGLVTLGRRWPELARCFRSARVLGALLASAVLVAVNWLVFIHAVETEQVLQTSLGYFITPLVNVAFGLAFFGERLRGGQWLALALAAAGVVFFPASGRLPWIALTLAVSFGLYGLVRKVTAVDGLVGLTVETVLLLPAALGFLIYQLASGTAAWGSAGPAAAWLLPLSGVVTAVPLVCFGQAARKLDLSVLAFLQYLSPSLAFVLAVVCFGEPFEPAQMVCFGCIWVALAIYSLDSVRAYRKRVRDLLALAAPGKFAPGLKRSLRMARIRPLEYADVEPAMRAEYDRQIAANGRVTNLKGTLAHSPVAFRALMQWYALRDEVRPFLGDRLTTLFAHAISAATDCLICSTFFRRHLIDTGENPDALTLDERERAVVEYGRQLARDPNGVGDELYGRLERFFPPAQIVALTAFGGLMVATNLVNNALRVDLDEYLQPYRKTADLTGDRR